MLENWCWNNSELKEMSCHYTRLGPEYLHGWKAQHPRTAEPDEQIPEELLDRLIESRNLDKALRLLQQT
jgi:metallopeptidase MepB